MRVAVTGLGVVSAAGVGHAAFWRRIIAGEVCTAAAQSLDTAGYASDRAGEVLELPAAASAGIQRLLELGLPPEELKRSTRLALAAAELALGDAGLSADDVAAAGDRVGVCMGQVVANRPELEGYVTRLWQPGSTAPPVGAGRFEWRHASEMVSRAPALAFGAQGPVHTLSNACAAGNWSIAHAADAITAGHADVMLAGGADELSPAMFMMFSQHNALSRDVVRPFDAARDGLILAEGAAVLLLEREDHARSRRATIYGYIGGYGATCDGHDMVHPDPQGFGAEQSMLAALRQASLAPSDIDYVSAHGTGTAANDRVEARAVRSVFGAHADGLPCSSIKSMIGHAQGAAGSLEAVACLLAMRDGIVPPTANHRSTDPDCPIDVVPNRARSVRVRACLSNAFGFGGNVCCLLMTQS